jgi:hypothetical protein
VAFPLNIGAKGSTITSSLNWDGGRLDAALVTFGWVAAKTCCQRPETSAVMSALDWYPRRESNLRTWFRKPLLYPLSYGGPENLVS